MTDDFPARIGIGDGPSIPCRVVAMDLGPSLDGPLVSGVRELDGTFRLDRVSVPSAPSPYDAFRHLRFELSEAPTFPAEQSFAERVAAITEHYGLTAPQLPARPPTMSDLADAVARERRFVDAQTIGAIPVGERRMLDADEVAGYFSRLRTASDFAVDVTAPPNSCARCGGQQRGHNAPHPYAEPSDALRLARMKARREARLNPPPRLPSPQGLFVTFTAHTEALQAAFARMAEAVRPLGERMANASRAIGEAADADPILASDLDWEAQSAVCCHVCGPDPGHCCDARATTSITHPLPSGGTRTLPLCGPCHDAEMAASRG